MSAADTLLTPLDAARSALYRLLAPWLSPLYGHRERRVVALGTFSILVSLGLTMTVPLWSLALAPLIFGVPHLLADVRYLVVRPGLHRKLGLVLLAAPPLLATSVGAGPEVGLLAAFPAILAAQGSWGRKGPLLVVWAVLLLLALRFGYGFQLVFLHLHNVVALAAWWLWRRRSALSLVLPLVLSAGVAALLSGAAEPVLTALHSWTAPRTGTSFDEFVATTTPLEDGVLAARLVLVFAFLQSVHYGVWLRLIPDEDRARPAPRTFRASWAALEADFGPWTLGGVVLAFVAIAAWGLVSLPQARLGYLHLAAFHGYLELAAGAYLLVEGRRW